MSRVTLDSLGIGDGPFLPGSEGSNQGVIQLSALGMGSAETSGVKSGSQHGKWRSGPKPAVPLGP